MSKCGYFQTGRMDVHGWRLVADASFRRALLHALVVPLRTVTGKQFVRVDPVHSDFSGQASEDFGCAA